MPDDADMQIKDHRAYGLAAEAIQAVRSHEHLTDFQYQSTNEKYEEIKKLINTVNEKMDAGFRALDKKYDSKFWSLAVTVIIFLLGICGFLIVQLLFKAH